MPWGLLILLTAGLLLAWLLLVLLTYWLLSHPPRRSYAFAVARNLPGDPSEITVTGDDGSVHRGLPFTQWSFRSRGIDLPVWDVTACNPSGPVIVLTHGWGDSRVVMLPRLAGLAPLASRIILWDLPAHGDAPAGTFTLGASEHEDLLALVQTLGTRSLGDRLPAPIYLYGASLGAGVSLVAAAILTRNPPTNPRLAGVIAEAPYRIPPVPARNVFRMRAMPYRTNLLPAMALLGLRFKRGLSWALSSTAGDFDRVLHARALSPETPVLVLHGSDDPICPLEDGRAIAAAATSADLAIIDHAGHNNLWIEPAFARRCRQAAEAFLDKSHTPDAWHKSLRGAGLGLELEQ